MRKHQLIVFGIVAIAIPLFFIGRFPEHVVKSKRIHKLPTPTKPNPYEQEMLAGFEVQLNADFEQTHTPGAAVVVVKGDAVVFMRGLGVRQTVHQILWIFTPCSAWVRFLKDLLACSPAFW